MRTAVADRSGPALVRARERGVGTPHSTEVLRVLNAQVALAGSDVAAVVSKWLDQEKLA